jgi:nitrite reductase/ring-hydroxylating ferredoxin subunit
MAWAEVLAAAELGDGGRMIVEVGGKSLLLLSHGGGFYAVAARCPHLGGSLEHAALTTDGGLVCPLHRSVFDLKTGAVRAWAPWPPLVGKVLGAMRHEQPLPVYPVRIEGGAIQVDLGEE